MLNDLPENKSLSKKKPKWWQNKRNICVLFCVIFAVFIALVVTLVASKKSCDDPKSIINSKGKCEPCGQF